jgi:hypothetical protein
MRPLHSLDRTFVALGDDHLEVDVALVVRLAPGVRAKEDDGENNRGSRPHPLPLSRKRARGAIFGPLAKRP